MYEHYNSRQAAMYGFPYHHTVNCSIWTGNHVSIGVGLANAFRYLDYNLRVATVVVENAPESVLDVGCGDGWFLTRLSEVSPDATLHGIDLEEKAIVHAKAVAGDVAEFFCGDVGADPRLLKSYDVVTAIEVLEHIPLGELAGFVDRLSIRVRPGGLLILTVPSVNLNIQRISRHVQHFTIDSLRNTIEANSPMVLVWGAYLNPRSRLAKALQKMADNRFYRLKESKLLDGLFGLYRLLSGRASSSNGLRVMAVFQNGEAK